MTFIAAADAKPKVPHKKGLACLGCGAKEASEWRGPGGAYCACCRKAADKARAELKADAKDAKILVLELGLGVASEGRPAECQAEEGARRSLAVAMHFFALHLQARRPSGAVQPAATPCRRGTAKLGEVREGQEGSRRHQDWLDLMSAKSLTWEKLRRCFGSGPTALLKM